jgi:hypothetical protein
MPSGKFQGGQIKNDLAFKLYLSAVQQGTALAPISAEPVPTPAGTGGETEPGSTNSDGTPQVDANKDGKDDTTGEPIKLPPAAGADATPDPDDVNAQVDANKDGKDDKTGEPMKVDPAAPTEPGDPDDAEVMKNEIGKANKSAIQKLKTALGMK